MKSSIVVLKDSDASHSDARIQTHQRALFLVVRHAEPAFIRVHVPRALGPFFFPFSPFFSLIVLRVPSGEEDEGD